MMKISSLLADYPILLDKWENFKIGRAYSKQSTKEKHNIFISSLQIRRKNNSKEDFLFKKAINYIENEELFYILKFMLTGKIEKKYKETIKELVLELFIDKELFCIYIRLSHPIYGEITDKSKKQIFRARNLKELRSAFNNFFQEKIKLPYLNNAVLGDKLSYNPITFATYFNCFFIDAVNPYKLFLSERSIFWRKRVLQLIIGFRGIALISFFKDLLAENIFHKKLLEDTKASIEKDILSRTEKRRQWQIKFLGLLEKERNLKAELQGIEDMGIEDIGTEDIGTEDIGTEDIGTEGIGTEDIGMEGTYSDITTAINLKIKQSSKSLQSYKTKELLILKEIKYLGGDFQKRRHFREETSKGQYVFSISDKDNENKEKIDELIGDYYINLSKIDILLQELKELSLGRKKELEKIRRQAAGRKKELTRELEDIISSIHSLLYKESISIESGTKELLQRSLSEEGLVIEQIISGLKRKYKGEHKRILYNFLILLKNRLINFFEGLVSVSISKDYIPILRYRDSAVVSFLSLRDSDRRQFIICFYLSLLEFSLSDEGHHPLILFMRGNFSSLYFLESFGDRVQVFLSSTG